MTSPETIIQLTSPNGNLQAFVEQDERAAHFYLWGGPESDFGVRCCWVRNLQPAYDAPDALVADMRAGRPPMLDKASCRHPAGEKPLEGDRLRIIWFEEGDAAALLEGDSVLAVIPSWSGQGDFSGYARDCVCETPIAWPLDGAMPILGPRIDAAASCWAAWSREPSPWKDLQEAEIEVFSALGAYTNYYAIDGGNWPPKAMLRIPVPGGVVLTTLGMALRPMPKVEGAHEDPSSHRRIELGVCLGEECASDEAVMAVARQVSSLANLPWNEFTWLGEGHTVVCDPIPGAEDYSAVLLSERPPASPSLAMPTYRGDQIKLLWLMPITRTEQELAERQGSGALLEHIRANGAEWMFSPRTSVV